jgi:hypothetical protein
MTVWHQLRGSVSLRQPILRVRRTYAAITPQ